MKKTNNSIRYGVSNNFYKHGKSDSAEHRTWSHIKSRCTNKKVPDYSRYGGRGITICKEWLNSFERFYKDMGERPSNKHSIDRIDVDGNYCKKNCRWATMKEQNSNRRDNMKYKGETATDASIRIGGSHSLVHTRVVKLGWSLKKAFTTPIKPLLMYKGDTVKQANKRLGGDETLIYRRIRRGWSIKDSFTRPFNGNDRSYYDNQE